MYNYSQVLISNTQVDTVLLEFENFISNYGWSVVDETSWTNFYFKTYQNATSDQLAVFAYRTNTNEWWMMPGDPNAEYPFYGWPIMRSWEYINWLYDAVDFRVSTAQTFYFVCDDVSLGIFANYSGNFMGWFVGKYISFFGASDTEFSFGLKPTGCGPWYAYGVYVNSIACYTPLIVKMKGHKSAKIYRLMHDHRFAPADNEYVLYDAILYANDAPIGKLNDIFFIVSNPDVSAGTIVSLTEGDFLIMQAGDITTIKLAIKLNGESL